MSRDSQVEESALGIYNAATFTLLTSASCEVTRGQQYTFAAAAGLVNKCVYGRSSSRREYVGYTYIPAGEP